MKRRFFALVLLGLFLLQPASAGALSLGGLNAMRAREAEALYADFLREELVPAYGFSNLGSMEALLEASMAMGTHESCLGLVSAAVADLDWDGRPELVTAVCVEGLDPYQSQTHILTLQVYACGSGRVLPVEYEGEGDIYLCSVESNWDTADFGCSYDLSLRMGERPMICSALYQMGGDCAWTDYSLYALEDGMLRKALEMEIYTDSMGQWQLYAKGLPDWLDAKEVLPQATDTWSEYSLYYADADGYGKEDVGLGYLTIYDVNFTGRDAAREAFLQPIEGVRSIRVLGPLYRDHSGVRTWMGAEEIAACTLDRVELLILEGYWRNYAEWEVYGLNQEEAALLRNGMYALSGKIFKTQAYQEYFGSKPWYYPYASDVSSIMNQYQRDNVSLISDYEKSMGWRD